MIGAIIGAVLLWVGGKAVLIDGSMSSDGFIKFFTFLFAMFQPAKKIAGVSVEINKGIASAQRVFNILDMDFNKKNNNDLINIKHFKNYIEFKDVDFSYNGTNKVLNNINIRIKKGEKIALVGRSGSGKTTFTNLILDFYQPNSGRIIIDDIHYKNVTSNSLRNLIGLVSQEPILFNDTIKNNIMYGTSLLEKNDKIINAASIANIKDFIESLPMFAIFKHILFNPIFIFNNVVFSESNVGTGGSSTNELIAVFVIETTFPEVRPCPVASPHMATHPPSSFCIKSKKSPPTSVAVC